MQKLKKSITQAHREIDEERKKNIELLNLIFPSQIARKLWMGR
jgi:guanylate cyclase soluble subunit alpha